MKRSGIRVDMAKQKEWQERSMRRAMERRRSRVREVKPKKRRPRRNDSRWRAECVAARGEMCRSCGDTSHVQMDHIMPRSQGGPSVVENGLPLCGDFSRNTPGGCHAKKTAGTMLIEPDWLGADQVEWLAEVGWVWWDDDGEPHGRGWKHFAPRRSRGSRKG